MEGTTVMDAINSAITNAVSLVGTAYNAMMDQPVVAIFVGASLVTLGMVLFGRMKRSAR